MSIVPDLREAIAQSPDGIAYFVDPVTGERFVAMREGSHERLRKVLECEVASGELVDAAMQDDDQDDPGLEVYQHFQAAAMNRGDVVIVEFPYVDGLRAKNRPALVVQNDHDNQRLANTIIAMITGNLRFAHLPTQILIDVNTADGKATGLVKSSAIKAGTLFTIQQRDILAVIGRLTDDSLRKFDKCLKAALDLS